MHKSVYVCSVKAQVESNPVNEVKRAFAVENMKLMFDRRSVYEFRSLTFKWFSKYLAPLQYFALCIVCSVFSFSFSPSSVFSRFTREYKY